MHFKIILNIMEAQHEELTQAGDQNDLKLQL